MTIEFNPKTEITTNPTRKLGTFSISVESSSFIGDVDNTFTFFETICYDYNLLDDDYLVWLKIQPLVIKFIRRVFIHGNELRVFNENDVSENVLFTITEFLKFLSNVIDQHTGEVLDYQKNIRLVPNRTTQEFLDYLLKYFHEFSHNYFVCRNLDAALETLEFSLNNEIVMVN